MPNNNSGVGSNAVFRNGDAGIGSPQDALHRWTDPGIGQAVNAGDSGSTQFSRRAEELDNFLQQAPPSLSAQIEPASDPTLAHEIQRFNYQIDSSIRFGRVQMVLPHANWYRVALDDMGGELPCIKLGGQGSYKLLGARDCSTIAPDARVVVIVPPTASYGFIVGVLSDLNEDGNHTYSDWISPGSNVGILRNRYYTEYLRNLSDRGGALMHSSGRPIDALATDWSQVTETGLMFHLDSAMVQMRVDEECGISCFYQDRFTRIAGTNLDVWTGARWQEDRNDEGEGTVFVGESPYPWEMTGAYSHGSDVSREVSDEDVLHNQPESKFEPGNNQLQPFVRYQEYGGYLGQPKMRLVALPPDGKANTSQTRKWSDTDKDLGVFREQITMDGGYGLMSAKHVYIAKSVIHPVPKRIRPNDDYSTNCDSTENGNYKFAGKYGGGDEHKVGDVTNNETEHRNLFSTSAILDYHAHAFNWKSVHAFHYHQKDFNLPQADEMPQASAYLPPFNDLARYMWLPTPTPKELDVDHRYGKAKYWALTSHLSLTEDGGVVLQGGQGEEIRFAGGNIQISCAGKILIQSGNTTAVLAGDDFIARAYNSADITSTNKDVRIKAEYNFQALAGNAGNGALLLENRSKTDKHEYPGEGGEKIRGTGIVFKAPNSVIASLGKDIYQRCSVEGQGQIVLDGDAGNSNVRVIANNVFRFIRSRARDGFGIPIPTDVNVYQAGANLLGSTVRIKGSLQSDGLAIFSGSVAAVNGHFLSSIGGQVGKILNRPLMNQQLDDMVKLIEDNRQQHAKDYDYEVQQKFYSKDQIGNRDTIRKISFSLRPELQYGTASDFLLPQTHWQILNNVIKAGKTWVENDVEYQQGTKMQPWPGKRAWSEQSTMVTLPADQFKLHDIEKGVPKDRPEPYKTAELGKFTRKTPSSSYSIIPGND